MRAAQREKPPSGLGPAGGFGVIIKKKYKRPSPFALPLCRLMRRKGQTTGQFTCSRKIRSAFCLRSAESGSTFSRR